MGAVPQAVILMASSWWMCHGGKGHVTQRMLKVGHSDPGERGQGPGELPLVSARLSCRQGVKFVLEGSGDRGKV